MEMRITTDRLAMLQRQNKTSGKYNRPRTFRQPPGGTEVLIEMPVIYD
jgi:hypothetical protein